MDNVKHDASVIFGAGIVPAPFCSFSDLMKPGFANYSDYLPDWWAYHVRYARVVFTLKQLNMQ